MTTTKILRSVFMWCMSLGTESCIRLVDVDGDGLQDIVIGVERPFLKKSYQSIDEMKTVCSQQGKIVTWIKPT